MKMMMIVYGWFFLVTAPHNPYAYNQTNTTVLLQYIIEKTAITFNGFMDVAITSSSDDDYCAPTKEFVFLVAK